MRRDRLTVGKQADSFLDQSDAAKNLGRPTWWDSISRSYTKVLGPSAAGLVAALTITALFSWLDLNTAHPFRGVTPLIPDDRLSGILETALQSQVAITAVALPLLIFVIDISRDRVVAPTTSTRVLIERSRVIPIFAAAATGAVHMVFTTLWLSTPAGAVIASMILIGTVGATVFSYLSVVRLLLSPTAFREATMTFLSESFRRTLHDNLRSWTQGVFLANELNALDLEYWPLGLIDEDDSWAVVAIDVSGNTLVDVDTDALTSLASVLSSLRKPATTDNVFGLPHVARPEPLAQVLVDIGFQTPSARVPVLRLRKSSFRELPIDRLSALCAQAFLFSDAADTTPTKELEHEIGALKDALVDAIRTHRYTLVEQIITLDRELVSQVLGDIYSVAPEVEPRRATLERERYQDVSTELGWIQAHLGDALEAAVRSGSASIARDVLYLPTALADIAASHSDYPVFRQFLGWIPYGYRVGINEGSPRVQEAVADRAWRYLLERVDYRLTVLVDSATTREQIAEISSLAKAVLLTLNSCLRVAYELRRRQDFDMMISALRGSLRSFGDRIFRRLRQLEDADSAESTAQDSARSAHRELIRPLVLMQRQIEFGLDAALLRDATSGRVKAPEFSSWHALLRPRNVSSEWTVFLASADDTAGPLASAWRSWEEPMRPDEGVRPIGVPGDLKLAFCVRAIERLAEDPAQVLELEAPSDARHLVDGSPGSLQSTLDTLMRTRLGLREFLNVDITAPVATLRDQLDLAYERLRADEQQGVIEAPLSADRLQEVADTFSHVIGERTVFRHALDRSPLTEQGVDCRHPLSIDFAHRDPKDAYIDQRRVSYQDWGRQYAEWIAAEEDDLIWRVLDSQFEKEEVPFWAETTPRKVMNRVSTYQRLGLEPVIVIRNGWPARRGFQSLPDWTPRATSEPATALGSVGSTRVFGLDSSSGSAILLVDRRKSLEWTPCRPSTVPGFALPLSLADIVFAVQEIDSALADAMSSADSSIAKNGQESIVRELRGSVIVRVQERMHLLVKDSIGGTIFTPSEPEEELY